MKWISVVLVSIITINLINNNKIMKIIEGLDVEEEQKTLISKKILISFGSLIAGATIIIFTMFIKKVLS